MKKSIVLIVLTIALFTSFVSTNTIKYKCLIQLTNYGGEGAYVIASVINPSGEYEQTLSVSGDDEEWYQDLPLWFEFYKSKKEKIDGITGASIQSGGRKIVVLEVDELKLNKGYKLRFESSVEDEKYFEKDIELDIVNDMVNKKIDGSSGYIRYIRIMQN